MLNQTFERELRDALRETLDREHGPDPEWASSPAAGRIAAGRARRWPIRTLAVAAVVGATGGALLLSGAFNKPTPIQSGPAGNGWVAFTVAEALPSSDGIDVDIWFTGIGRDARRVVGTEKDDVDEICPAFSFDGRRLAYARLEGIEAVGGPGRYRNVALVIADVSADGDVTNGLAVEVGDTGAPPCAIWSPDGMRLAFGSAGDAVNGNGVRVLRVADRQVTEIPDLLANDIEWSPDGTLLAIAGGSERSAGGLNGPHLWLYDVTSGTLRTFDDTLGATNLAWSPDGKRIAYSSRGDHPSSATAFDSAGGMGIVDVTTGRQSALLEGYKAIHGVGPVWSPDGKTIAFQRSIGGERHEIALVSADAGGGAAAATPLVLRPTWTTEGGDELQLWPWRVTWSPDGSNLLDVAWVNRDQDTESTVIVAVPTDPGARAVVLATMDGIGAYDFSQGTIRVPIQVWQRQP